MSRALSEVPNPAKMSSLWSCKKLNAVKKESKKICEKEKINASGLLHFHLIAMENLLFLRNIFFNTFLVFLHGEYNILVYLCGNTT